MEFAVGCEGFEPLSRLPDFTDVSRGQLKIQAFLWAVFGSTTHSL